MVGYAVSVVLLFTGYTCTKIKTMKIKSIVFRETDAGRGFKFFLSPLRTLFLFRGDKRIFRKQLSFCISISDVQYEMSYDRENIVQKVNILFTDVIR